MAISTHEVLVVQISLQNHPNADSLSIVNIDEYTVCVRTDDWKDGQLAAYIPPDSIVKTTRPEFSFLKKEGKDEEKIKVIKLRGIISMGLLVPAPKDSVLGDDVSTILEVEHYEPKINLRFNTDNIRAPNILAPVYNIETIRKYSKLLENEETVFVFEKIHGANARYVFYENEMYVGSRRNWKSDGSLWHQAIVHHPQIRQYCQDFPNNVIYGEIYGQVQNLKYGLTDVNFMAFDILENNKWMEIENFIKICEEYKIPTVPLLYSGPYSFNKIQELAEGNSVVDTAKHIREGCVIRPQKNRFNAKIGRIILKCVGNGYYLNKKI